MDFNGLIDTTKHNCTHSFFVQEGVWNAENILDHFSAQVTRLCPLEEVRLTQLDNTYILSNCTVCLRALSKAGGAWYCDRCWRFPNLCSLCHRVVKGLYVWCQVRKHYYKVFA